MTTFKPVDAALAASHAEFSARQYIVAQRLQGRIQRVFTTLNIHLINASPEHVTELARIIDSYRPEGRMRK